MKNKYPDRRRLYELCKKGPGQLDQDELQELMKTEGWWSFWKLEQGLRSDRQKLYVELFLIGGLPIILLFLEVFLDQ